MRNHVRTTLHVLPPLAPRAISAVQYSVPSTNCLFLRHFQPFHLSIEANADRIKVVPEYHNDGFFATKRDPSIIIITLPIVSEREFRIEAGRCRPQLTSELKRTQKVRREPKRKKKISLSPSSDWRRREILST